MKKENAISIVEARDLESRDLFAYETAGRLCSGLVISVTYATYQLDEATRSYMEGKHNLTIPEDEFAPLGGENQYFVMYQPRPWFGWSTDDYEHIFLDSSSMVAVFGYNPAYNREKNLIDVPECSE